MDNIKSDSISIQLDNNLTLVADTIPTSPYKEIYVYLKREGVIEQDLAMIRESYVYDEEDNVVRIPNKYEVFVYGDHMSEDYTHHFSIDEYIGE